MWEMETCSILTFYHITHRCTVSLQNVVANEFVNSQPVKHNQLDTSIIISSIEG